MSTAIRELSGLQKAGVLMISLGAEASAKVFDCLTPEERDLLGSEIVKLNQVDNTTRRRVLDEVNRIVRTHSVQEAIAVQEPNPIDSNEPLKWLEALDPREVAEMISRERPQNIALVLANIAPQAAAGILSNLSENARNNVAQRLISMKPVAKEAIEAVDKAMRKRSGMAQSSSRANSFFGGATERVRESVKSALGKADIESLPKIGRMFDSAEDLAQLPDGEIKAVLFGLDMDDVGMALRVASEDMRSAVLRNVSDEVGLMLRRVIASTSQIRVREIEQAQMRIIDALNKLSGEAQHLEAVVG